MATLNYRHFGNPGRRRPEARYEIVNRNPCEKGQKLSFLPFHTTKTIVMRFSADLVDYTPRRLVAAD